jgi:hypothetical protein
MNEKLEFSKAVTNNDTVAVADMLERNPGLANHHSDLFKHLLFTPSSPNSMPIYLSPLHYAVLKNWPDMVTTLLTHKANIDSAILYEFSHYTVADAFLLNYSKTTNEEKFKEEYNDIYKTLSERKAATLQPRHKNGLTNYAKPGSLLHFKTKETPQPVIKRNTTNNTNGAPRSYNFMLNTTIGKIAANSIEPTGSWVDREDESMGNAQPEQPQQPTNNNADNYQLSFKILLETPGYIKELAIFLDKEEGKSLINEKIPLTIDEITRVMTPIYYSVTTSDLPLTKLLIEKGADINSISETNMTPLDRLLKHAAGEKSEEKQTIAILKNKDLYELLKQNGAKANIYPDWIETFDKKIAEREEEVKNYKPGRFATHEKYTPYSQKEAHAYHQKWANKPVVNNSNFAIGK